VPGDGGLIEGGVFTGEFEPEIDFEGFPLGLTEFSGCGNVLNDLSWKRLRVCPLLGNPSGSGLLNQIVEVHPELVVFSDVARAFHPHRGKVKILIYRIN
jgi:hypothetical protein